VSQFLTVSPEELPPGCFRANKNAVCLKVSVRSGERISSPAFGGKFFGNLRIRGRARPQVRCHPLHFLRRVSKARVQFKVLQAGLKVLQTAFKVLQTVLKILQMLFKVLQIRCLRCYKKQFVPHNPNVFNASGQRCRVGTQFFVVSRKNGKCSGVAAIFRKAVLFLKLGLPAVTPFLKTP
jgi:hypothetical protein